MLGVSYRDVPIRRLADLEGRADEVWATLGDMVKRRQGPHGALVLSTCNRFEVYVDGDVAVARRLLTPLLGDVLTVVEGEEAIRHLFSVASGLDSMVAGENEIAGQVRDALRRAQGSGLGTATLTRIFERALSASRRVRGLGRPVGAGRSVASVGLDLVVERHGSLDGSIVLLIGTGSLARSVVNAVFDLGADAIGVFSPSGRRLAFEPVNDDDPNTFVVTPGNLESVIRQANVVIGCSGRGGRPISSELIALARSERGILPILDLAVSSDFDPEVSTLEFVDFIDLESIRRRESALESDPLRGAQRMIDDAVEEFVGDLRARRASSTIASVRRSIDRMIDEEVRRVEKRLGPAAADEVRRSLRKLANSILHEPIVRLKDGARSRDDEAFHRAMDELNWLANVEIGRTLVEQVSDGDH